MWATVRTLSCVFVFALATLNSAYCFHAPSLQTTGLIGGSPGKDTCKLNAPRLLSGIRANSMMKNRLSDSMLVPCVSSSSAEGSIPEAVVKKAGLFKRLMNGLVRIGRSMVSLLGSITSRFPKPILRLLIGGFVKGLKAQQMSLDELHYIFMGELNLADFYKLALNERSLNVTATDYGGLVNFIDAKAKEEAAKILPQIDHNGDGILTGEELVKYVKDTVSLRAATVKANVTAAFDADGDGLISPKEVLEISMKTVADHAQKVWLSIWPSDKQ